MSSEYLGSWSVSALSHESSGRLGFSRESGFDCEDVWSTLPAARLSVILRQDDTVTNVFLPSLGVMIHVAKLDNNLHNPEYSTPFSLPTPR